MGGNRRSHICWVSLSRVARRNIASEGPSSFVSTWSGTLACATPGLTGIDHAGGGRITSSRGASSNLKAKTRRCVVKRLAPGQATLAQCEQWASDDGRGRGEGQGGKCVCDVSRHDNGFRNARGRPGECIARLFGRSEPGGGVDRLGREINNDGIGESRGPGGIICCSGDGALNRRHDNDRL